MKVIGNSILNYSIKGEHMNQILKPKKRSKLRLFIGKIYYRTKKYLYWHFSNKSYSKKISNNKLEYLVFTHQTPLYRKLKDVDMYHTPFQQIQSTCHLFHDLP